MAKPSTFLVMLEIRTTDPALNFDDLRRSHQCASAMAEFTETLLQRLPTDVSRVVTVMNHDDAALLEDLHNVAVNAGLATVLRPPPEHVQH
jgi:hypothetical protein